MTLTVPFESRLTPGKDAKNAKFAAALSAC